MKLRHGAMHFGGNKATFLGKSMSGSAPIALLFWLFICVCSGHDSPDTWFDLDSGAGTVWSDTFYPLSQIGLGVLIGCSSGAHILLAAKRTAVSFALRITVTCVCCLAAYGLIGWMTSIALGWTAFATMFLAVFGTQLAFSRLAIWCGWTWRSDTNVWLVENDRSGSLSLVEHKRLVAARSGWISVGGLMVFAMPIRLLLHWMLSESWRFSEYVENVPTLSVFLATIYLSLLASIAFVVCVHGHVRKKPRGMLLNAILILLIWLAVDASAIAIAGIEQGQLVSLVLLMLLCIPFAVLIHAALKLTKRKRLWIGPSRPGTKTHLKIRDLMLITLMVGLQLAAIRLSRDLMVYAILFGILGLVALLTSIVFLRCQFGAKPFIGWVLVSLTHLLVLGAELIRAFVVKNHSPFLVILSGAMMIGLCLASLFLVAGWLDQTGWRRFESTTLEPLTES